MSKSVTPLLALFFALTVFSAHAQLNDRRLERPVPTKAPDKDAMAMTREMTNRLQLNERQFMLLLPLNRTKLMGVDRINAQFASDEATRAAKTAELEAQYEQECSRILTPSQLSQLQQSNGQPAPAPATTGNGLG